MSTTDLVLAQSGPQGTIMPVVPYSMMWAILGVLLVTAVIVYYLLAYQLTRPRPERVPAPEPPRLVSVPELQHDYLIEVDTVARRYRAGELTPRRAHAELSIVIRDFITQATGVEADKMTLTELRRTPFVGASHAVSEFYPLVFGVDETRTVEHGIDAARQVIALWR